LDTRYHLHEIFLRKGAAEFHPQIAGIWVPYSNILEGGKACM